MTLEAYEVVEAEVVPTKMEAVASIERAIEHAEGFWKEILWQVQNRVWEALNYESFDALWEHRYAGLGVRIDRRERPELVAELRQIGQTQQEIADKLGVSQQSVSNDLREVNTNFGNQPASITNSRGQERPSTYKTKPKDEWPVVPPAEPDGEKEMPATLAHKTPYKPGHVLTMDSRATKPLITVGEDGRATSTRESYIKAMSWWRENPRAQQYEAAKATGLPTSAMSETSSALRKNGEIPKVSNSGRAPIEEFGLLATAVKNLGLSVEKMLSEGTFEFIDSEGMDYYMDGLRDGMKSLRKFQQLAQQISNN